MARRLPWRLTGFAERIAPALAVPAYVPDQGYVAEGWIAVLLVAGRKVGPADTADQRLPDSHGSFARSEYS